MLWFMGLQRVRHDWVTELNWTELKFSNFQTSTLFRVAQDWLRAVPVGWTSDPRAGFQHNPGSLFPCLAPSHAPHGNDFVSLQKPLAPLCNQPSPSPRDNLTSWLSQNTERINKTTAHLLPSNLQAHVHLCLPLTHAACLKPTLTFEFSPSVPGNCTASVITASLHLYLPCLALLASVPPWKHISGSPDLRKMNTQNNKTQETHEAFLSPCPPASNPWKVIF